MLVYSCSKLETYETCPKQHKLKYIECIELPEGKRARAFLGVESVANSLKMYKIRVIHLLNPKYFDGVI